MQAGARRAGEGTAGTSTAPATTAATRRFLPCRFMSQQLLMSRLYPQIEASNSPAWKEDKSEPRKGISWQAQVVCQYLGLV